MQRALVFVLFASSACRVALQAPPDASSDAASDASSDARKDGEAGLDWFMVCKAYYAQAGLGSPSCSNCENGVCGPETLASLNACSDNPDSKCFVQCQGATPSNEDCTCLKGCLSAACESASATAESCQMAACGSACK